MRAPLTLKSFYQLVVVFDTIHSPFHFEMERILIPLEVHLPLMLDLQVQVINCYQIISLLETCTIWCG